MIAADDPDKNRRIRITAGMPEESSNQTAEIPPLMLHACKHDNLSTVDVAVHQFDVPSADFRQSKPLPCGSPNRLDEVQVP